MMFKVIFYSPSVPLQPASSTITFLCCYLILINTTKLFPQFNILKNVDIVRKGSRSSISLAKTENFIMHFTILCKTACHVQSPSEVKLNRTINSHGPQRSVSSTTCFFRNPSLDIAYRWSPNPGMTNTNFRKQST